MKKIILSLSLFALLILPVQNVHAISLGGIFGCGAAEAGGAAGTLMSAAQKQVTKEITGVVQQKVPILDQTGDAQRGTQLAKECVLDGLVVAIRQGIITATTQSIVTWINSGFEGGPSFVTDLNRYMGEIANDTSLDFIRGTELGFLCSPFSLEVRLALTTKRQPFQQRITCSLGGVINDTEKFFSGSFKEGGWPGWFKVATSLQNNPYGSYLLASEQLETRIASNQGEQLNLLNFGNGFLSPRECVEYATDPETGVKGTECARYEITTPGAIVNDTLSKHLGSGLRQLELADEIDEIINALMAQLSQQVITSAQGLRGLSENSSGQGSFLNRLADESSSNARNAVGDVVGRDIDSSITFQETYRATLTEALAELDTFEQTLALAGHCDAALSDIQIATLQAYGIEGVTISQLATTAQQMIDTNRVRYETLLENSAEATNALVSVRTDMIRGRTLQDIDPVINEYDSYVQSGQLGNTSDIFSIQTERASLQNIMTAIQSGIGTCVVGL